MTPERWQKIEPILSDALELDKTNRAAFLKEVCADDFELLHEIETLIDAYDEAETFIENPLIGKSTESDFTERRIGAYILKKEIGRGGMGTVYLAERADGEFHQKVAIKLIKRGMDTDFILRRFRNERQILAALNHPNIAYLLDGGTTDDNLPYFVMEYVEGESVTNHCEKLDSVEEKLRLFLQICSAVFYAHQKKIIYRDLKPSNILVNSDGTPKLLDFGIAKILDPKLAHGTYDPTTLSLRMMTPEYASPEQLRGETVTAASDQYSLGVLLYKILTGVFPYQINFQTPQEIVRIISEEEPFPPSRIGIKSKSKKTDYKLLDAIILKTLRKNPAERYDSVKDFATDLESFIEDHPIKAHLIFAAETITEKNPSRPKPLAVLPFKIFEATTANKAEDEFLRIGLADALIVRLSKLSRLTLCPTSAVLTYINDQTTSLDAGRKLGAGFVVEGTIRRFGEQVRVTAQLITVSEGAMRWAESFNEKLTDILELEDLISTRIAESLLPHLTGEERQSLEKRGTNSAEAYEFYLRGRGIWHSYSDPNLALAAEYFQKAVELDPNFANAHSGLADIYIALGIVPVLPPFEAFKIAKKHARRAVEIDPNLAEAYASLGFVTWAYDWNTTESVRLFKKSFELNENYAPAHEWFAHVLASEGRFDEAIAEMDKARQIVPDNAHLNAMTAYIYHNARRHAEGALYIERAAEIEPENYLALQGFGWMYPPLGRAREAIFICEKAVEISNRSPFCLWILGCVFASEGETERVQRIIDELQKMSFKRYVSPYYFAVLHTMLGNYDEAFRWLEKVINDREYWAQWLAVEYRLDPIRSDQKFAKLLEKVKSHVLI